MENIEEFRFLELDYFDALYQYAKGVYVDRSELIVSTGMY